MIEIRPIRRDEAEAFLELLCDVFSLDLVRAHSIFFTEPMFDISRKWALFVEGEITSILTTTPLVFGWGRGFGIAGVATRRSRQGQGHAARLLRHVLAESRVMGETGALLFAKDARLYECVGFQTLDVVVRADLRTAPCEPPDPFFDDAMRPLYDEWAAAEPGRLRRDDLRWRYWNWHFRMCSPFQDGYLCYEPGLLREMVFADPVDCFPLPASTEWFGLQSMADAMSLPISNPRSELHLMGHNVPVMPQMFMTDQF
jgi:GNAT superfamily N-acetyltransferase